MHFPSGFGADDCSNSSWKGDPEQSNVGQYKLDSLTVELKQRLCLKFLIPMAEYQDVSILDRLKRSERETYLQVVQRNRAHPYTCTRSSDSSV